MRRVPAGWSVRASGLVMFLIVLQGLVWLYTLNRPSAADRQAGDRIVNMIRDTKGDILTERRIMFSLLAGRQPQIEACTLYFAHQIGRDGTPDAAKGTCWDPAELLRAIREHRFPLIVFAGEFFPDEVVQAIKKNYRKLDAESAVMNNWHGSNTYVFAVP
jgi:hypothetical protein